MNSRSSKRKKKKDRTWAEAATLALKISPKKMLGIRQILQTIHQKKLKEVSLNKAAENVLTTMLNHHAQLPNCPFFRVKGRLGLYALKKSWLKKNGESVPEENYEEEVYDDDEDICLAALIGTQSSCDDRLTGSADDDGRENHTFSIQGRAIRPGSNSQKSSKSFPKTTFSKKSTLSRNVAASIGSSRRHSSPMVFPCRSTRSSVRHHHSVVRANSFTTRYPPSNDHLPRNSPKRTPTLDLETPSSILVNANMRALVNRETFSMLPASYRYMLTRLLPDCDQALADTKVDDQKVPVPSDTALTNEFFTQAVQEWRERLTDGEFTQETQSRIVQEIAKERSKIDPWKEKFFEEYYGQKQVPKKRLRSRSQNLAAETGHKMRDLGMEAQLQLFAHLRPELEENKTAEMPSSDSEPQISEDEDFFDPSPLPRKPSRSNNLQLRALAVANSFKKMSYAERVAKSKLINSKLTSLRTTNKIAPPTLKKLASKEKPTDVKSKENHLTNNPPAKSAIVMKPSWSLSAFSRTKSLVNASIPNGPWNIGEPTLKNEDNSKTLLNVQKRDDDVSTAMADHTYTSKGLWQKNSTNSSTNNNRTVQSNTVPRSSTTLVLCPSGNLVHSTIASMNSDKLLKVAKKEDNSKPSTTDHNTRPNRRDNIEHIQTVLLKPAAHMLTVPTPPVSSDTERVLSLRARPLTPESFAPGSVKPAGVISVKRVRSPLLSDTVAENPALNDNTKLTAKPGLVSKDANLAKEVKPPLLKPSKIIGMISPAATCTSVINPTKDTATTTISKRNLQETPYPIPPANPLPSFQPQLSSTTTTFSTSYTTMTSFSSSKSTLPSVVPTTLNSINPLLAMKHVSEKIKPPFFTPPPQMFAPRVPLPAPGSSPLTPGRLSIAGTKRSLPVSPPAFSPSSPPSKWGGSSSSSPTPMKKTRTLAEIKAQMKAKKAAAATIRPMLEHHPGVVAANSRTHIFSATTFPVYFPMVADGSGNLPINHTQHPLHPNTASYFRLPTTATLPLEKVQWVSHNMAPPGQVPMPPNQLFSKPPIAEKLVEKQQPAATIATPMTSMKHEPVTGKPDGRGKITLKIKAAGSAISLKVDADVLKKELKRSAHSTPSDEDASSDESNSEESDVERPKIAKHRGPIKLAKLNRHSSGSESDAEKSSADRRWALNAIDTGQKAKQINNLQAVPVRKTPVTSPSLLTKPPPKFGVPPFNVSVKPATTFMGPPVNNLTKNNLFPSTAAPLSFSAVPVSSSWSASKVISSTSSFTKQNAVPVTSSQSNKYRSTSKGKSLQNMQELARTNMIHSDDSAEEDSSEDEDPCDSTFSTTTASENEKGSESDGDAPARSWPHGRSAPANTLSNNKRKTRSSKAENDQNSLIKTFPNPAKQEQSGTVKPST